MSRMTDSALATRSRAAAGEWRRPAAWPGAGAPGQLIVKVIGNTKSAAGVVRMVRYVARESERFTQPVVLRDEVGDCPADTRAALEDWELLDDDANRSAKARKLIAENRLAELAELDTRERLHRVQAWHLAVSVKTGDDDREGVLADLEEAGRGAIDEIFGQSGRQAIWAVHSDGKEPHLHIVVEGCAGEEKRSLQLDPHGQVLDSWRETFVRHCRDCGLNVTAERRVDREEIRERILTGDEPLKASWSMHRAKTGKSDLALRVPVWFVRNGLDFERRELALAAKRQQAQRAVRPGRGRKAAAEDFEAALRSLLPPAASRRRRPVEPEFQELRKLVDAAFVDSSAALASWRKMATEGAFRDEKARLRHPNRALAAWWLIHRPQAFGDITAAALDLKSSAALKALLRRVRPAPLAAERSLRRPDVEAMGGLRAERAALTDAARRVAERAKVARELERLAALAEARYGPSGRVERIRANARQALAPTPAPDRPPSLVDRLFWRFARGRTPDREA